MTKACLINIWTRRKWGGPMTTHQSVRLITNKGIQGAVSCGTHRQITIIEQEVWHKVMKKLSSHLPPQTRRANLMLAGIKLQDTKGKILTIGECQLSIMGETTPCEAMEAKLPGLQAALKPNWNGGVFARVLKGGQINVNDWVNWH